MGWLLASACTCTFHLVALLLSCCLLLRQQLLLHGLAVSHTPVDVHVAHAEGRVLTGGNLLIIEDHPLTLLHTQNHKILPIYI
jgi:hypothetical protein